MRERHEDLAARGEAMATTATTLPSDLPISRQAVVKHLSRSARPGRPGHRQVIRVYRSLAGTI